MNPLKMKKEVDGCQLWGPYEYLKNTIMDLFDGGVKSCLQCKKDNVWCAYLYTKDIPAIYLRSCTWVWWCGRYDTRIYRVEEIGKDEIGYETELYDMQWDELGYKLPTKNSRKPIPDVECYLASKYMRWKR